MPAGHYSSTASNARASVTRSAALSAATASLPPAPVADPQHDPRFARGLGCGRGILELHAERLLAQHRHASPGERLHELGVLIRGRRDQHPSGAPASSSARRWTVPMRPAPTSAMRI
jgi:hypothetical protein